MERYPSTGIDPLDEILTRLQYGDNVVWQVDDIAHYREMVIPYVQRAIREKRKMVYVRFANHPPLLEPCDGLTIVTLDADGGFETFSTQVHTLISEQGVGAYYVFDSLSDLLSAWATDLMVGNFFMVTCPYLYELDTIAYFALLRDYHSYQTVARIRSTTQLLLDLYKLEGERYIHPLKVWNRYTPTMFLPHRDQGPEYTPVTNSVDAARLFSYISDRARASTRRKVDYWDRLFLQAEDMVDMPSTFLEVTEAVDQMCRVMVGREERMVTLARQHFSLRDLLDIKARLIGTGYVGGKSVGMLLARKILTGDPEYDWKEVLERHDSFYIGSDIFHTYIVQNGLWKVRMEQKTPEGYFAKAPELAAALLKGKFPNEIKEQFMEMIEYFGQSPIIVRSSSLLEDSFGNAFAGKYESIFLVNQGSPEDRYTQFEQVVRKIYASTVNEDALTYRLQRGLDQMDEQMSLLVQRVSGTHHGEFFYPDLAGVGVSYNTFVWNRSLDPEAGMARIVMGLGTRAVNRVEDDYPRIVAMDAPLVRPSAAMDNRRQFSQRYLDVLNLKDNQLEAIPVKRVLNEETAYLQELVAERDEDAESRMTQLGLSAEPQWILTLDGVMSKTQVVPMLRRLMETLEARYQYPVDVEFTINFGDDHLPRINLLQCRPLQTRGLGKRVQLPQNLSPSQILFQTSGSFMGGSVAESIRRIVFVDPAPYIALAMQDKYGIARLIGKLNALIEGPLRGATMLMGPGRWGTTTPSLGVPVHFAELNRFSTLCEMSYPSGNLMPELSYGSHFFQDLVESGIFYVALFCEKSDVVFNKTLLQMCPNALTTLLPEAQQYAGVVKVCDTADIGMHLMADILTQTVVCYKNA
jgi:hypothetical protein